MWCNKIHKVTPVFLVFVSVDGPIVHEISEGLEHWYVAASSSHEAELLMQAHAPRDSGIIVLEQVGDDAVAYGLQPGEVRLAALNSSVSARSPRRIDQAFDSRGEAEDRPSVPGSQ